MSYTYPEAIRAFESIANDYIRLMKPTIGRVNLRLDNASSTASVTWGSFDATVNLPVRPAASRMTQAEFEDWTAYLLHELGHPTHTDWNTWEKACKRGLGRLTNALEDVRMEQAVIGSKIVPNAKRVLSRLVSRKIAEARGNKWNPNSRKEIGWTICVLGRAANGYDIDAADVAWIKSQINPKGTVAKVLSWAMPELAKCSDTADCVALAERIQKAISEPAQKPGNGGDQGKGPANKPTSEPGNEREASPSDVADEPSSGSEGEGEESGTDEGEEGETGTSEGEDEGEGEGEGEGLGSKNGAGGNGHGDGSKTDPDETPVTDESELTERELMPEGQTITNPREAMIERTVIDILRSDHMTAGPGGINRQNAAPTTSARMTERTRKASKQRALLARALRANETDDREGGKRSGRLGTGTALVRAMAGSQSVFSKREISEGYDTDVHILIDASGSMSGQRLQSALDTGLIVAQAAGSVGASCTTEVFNSCGFTRAGMVAGKRTPNVNDFATLVQSSAGCTPLAPNIARASIAQAKRATEKRRVMFVITDGDCDYGRQAVETMARYLEQHYGTVFAHVSIENPVRGAFKAEVCIERGQNISDVGLDHFTKVLQAL